jgi:hypothetical protein
MILDPGSGAVGGAGGGRLVVAGLFAIALAVGAAAGFRGGGEAACCSCEDAADRLELQEVDLEELDDEAWLEDAGEGYDDDECDVDASEEPVAPLADEAIWTSTRVGLQLE